MRKEAVPKDKATRRLGTVPTPIRVKPPPIAKPIGVPDLTDADKTPEKIF
jgi:hypothetical protein